MLETYKQTNAKISKNKVMKKCKQKFKNWTKKPMQWQIFVKSTLVAKILPT